MRGRLLQAFSIIVEGTMGAQRQEKKRKKSKRTKSKQSKAPSVQPGGLSLRGSIQDVQAHIQVLHCPSIKQALWRTVLCTLRGTLPTLGGGGGYSAFTTVTQSVLDRKQVTPGSQKKRRVPAKIRA